MRSCELRMRKNSKIHFWIETENKKLIEKLAMEEGLTISDYCRNRFKENSKLTKIESTVDKILFLLENRKVYK